MALHESALQALSRKLGMKYRDFLDWEGFYFSSFLSSFFVVVIPLQLFFFSSSVSSSLHPSPVSLFVLSSSLLVSLLHNPEIITKCTCLWCEHLVSSVEQTYSRNREHHEVGYKHMDENNFIFNIWRDSSFFLIFKCALILCTDSSRFLLTFTMAGIFEK